MQRRSDSLFQVLLDTLPHAAFLIRPDGTAEYYNVRMVEYLGFRPGPSRGDRTALQHPDDQARLEQERAAGVASSGEYIVEARIRRHDGVYRWHRVHNKPLIDQGAVIAWVGTAVDVHDIREANAVLEERVRARTAELEETNRRLLAEIEQRRISELRFRTMYNRTPMALQSVDANARLLDINDTWVELFGYTREEAVGRHPSDFMTAESAEAYRRQAWPEMLASDSMTRTVDFQFITRDGRIFDGRLAGRGEFDADGSFIRSWSAIADVTAEKRADREMRKTQRLEALGQLTAGIAHDFNNLLTAILGNLEMLLKRPSADPARNERLLIGARSAAERGARLTGQLLAFSRQQRIVAEPVDLNAVVHEMQPLLTGAIGGQVRIELELSRGLWIAQADPTQLQLALMNLAINARDAMPDGGTITVRTANVMLGAPSAPEEPAPGAYVAVSVSDTGSGIPDLVRERMFEPFFTTKPVGRGSGLGLPQVLGVVKQLEGGMGVQTAPGKGTTFTLYLPRTQEATEVPDRTSATAPPDTANADRVILVDDDPDVRIIAADMLRDAGYDVTEAESGPAALDVLASGWSPSAMVIDVAMPGMTGVELEAVVRDRHPELPVVFMTGYAAMKLLPALASHDVLRKPFQAAELEAAVSKALSRR